MSVNRSVQAAQRRRAGPTNAPEPPRGPSTSINSAQMFANQARPGAGPSIPAGRLAAQQMSQSQQARMQQQQQLQQQQQVQDSGLNKMTVAQAITLITLRLGKVEQTMFDIEHSGMLPSSSSSSSSSSLDNAAMDSIVMRLESLEKRPAASGDVSLLKQQIDAMKPLVIQSKNLVKENGELKTEVSALKNEVVQLKEIVESLRTEMVAIMSMNVDEAEHLVDLEVENENENENEEVFHDDDVVDNEVTLEMSEIEPNPEQEPIADTTEIVGTDLKQMIEQELNSNVENNESFATMRQKKNRRR